MNRLNFATYAKTIKKGIPKATNIGVTKLLLDFIVNDESVVNKEGYQYNINNYYVNKWFNQHNDIPANIKKAASCPRIISLAENYFENQVINSLSPQKELDTYSHLLNLIKKDSTISNDIKNYLLNLYKYNDLGKFLSETFLYALQKDNKYKYKKDKSKENTYFQTKENINQTMEIYGPIPPIVKLTPKKSLEDHESIYTSQLLIAYAHAEGVEKITTKDLIKYPKYYRDFERQREYYYAAKSVIQYSKDIFLEYGVKEFKILMEEIYHSIIDLLEEEYSNNFKRLNAVMAHASKINLRKSFLAKIPQWIGVCEVKGFYHILVNEGIIKWA